MRRNNIVTVEDQVFAKIDIVIEKAEVILDMFPDNLHTTVTLLPDSGDVSRMYSSKYGKKVDHIIEVRPPNTIHELIAQFTEKHITD